MLYHHIVYLRVRDLATLKGECLAMKVEIKYNSGNHAGHRVEISKKPHPLKSLEDQMVVQSVMSAINEAYYSDLIPESEPAVEKKLA